MLGSRGEGRYSPVASTASGTGCKLRTTGLWCRALAGQSEALNQRNQLSEKCVHFHSGCSRIGAAVRAVTERQMIQRSALGAEDMGVRIVPGGSDSPLRGAA